MNEDIHVKNIRIMKFYGQIFKIHTREEIYKNFEDSKSV